METPPLSKAQILQSIKETLENLPSPPEPRPCVHCGTLMRFISTHFLLRGTEMNWNVPLPFCPVCDKEILLDIPCRETAH